MKPSFPFYPDDWMNDLGLRACSLASRAVWMDMICLMHQGQPYGHLANKAGALTIGFLAGRCGVTTKEVVRAMSELEQHGVYSTSEDGVIFSRRMVRDERNRIARGKGGSKSQMHPAVPRVKGILSAGEVKVSFHPEEVEVKEVSEIKKLPKKQNGQNGSFDPMPGWMRFASMYPAHRINEWTDHGVWIGVVETKAVEDEIFEKLPAFLKSAQWTKNGGEFVPAASKFLGERIFRMAVPVSQPSKASVLDEVLPE